MIKTKLGDVMDSGGIIQGEAAGLVNVSVRLRFLEDAVVFKYWKASFWLV